jgi:hypothetical protein
MLKEEFIAQVYDLKEKLKVSAKSLRDIGILLFNSKLNSSPLSRVKKTRKSSIRAAQQIRSSKADLIVTMLKKDSSSLLKVDDELMGKKSLAYVIWALGHADRARIKEGVSIHDLSALLYKACNINLYPINISRVLYKNENLVRQASQEKKTKTYVLTPAGKQIFKEKFL